MGTRKSNAGRNGRFNRPNPARKSSDGVRQPGATIGMLEWFRPGEHDRVDAVLDGLAALGVTELRTGISWADCWTPEGEAWYAWLFPQLARRVNLLPCFVDTPPGWGVAPKVIFAAGLKLAGVPTVGWPEDRKGA